MFGKFKVFDARFCVLPNKKERKADIFFDFWSTFQSKNSIQTSKKLRTEKNLIKGNKRKKNTKIKDKKSPTPPP